MFQGRIAAALLSLSVAIGSFGPIRILADTPSTLVFPAFGHTWGIQRGTSWHLFLLVGQRTRFNDPQGLAAVRLRSWEDPAEEFDDDELTVYGVNSGEHNIIYNTSMYSLGVYGDKGAGKDQFLHPQGIAADEQGNLFIADTGNHRVVHLLNSGRELTWLGSIGSYGVGPGRFQSPSGVALDSRGLLYVTDAGGSRIQIFDDHDRYVREIKGDFFSPTSIAVIDSQERWSCYRETYLCVVDSGGLRLQKLSPQGALLQRVRGPQTGMSHVRFGYVAIDYYGNVWVSDMNNHCVHKFDRHLNFIVSFGRRGKGDGEFVSPRGIAIWKRFGQVFVADEMGAQYYWVGVDVLDLQVYRDSRGLGFVIRYFLTERAYVTVEIQDRHGKSVRALLARKEEPIGHREYRWDGRDSQGKALPPGGYTVKMVAEPTYSSYRYFQKVLEERIRL